MADYDFKSSSLEELFICDEGESLSSTKSFSLSKLSNLQYLEFIVSEASPYFNTLKPT